MIAMESEHGIPTVAVHVRVFAALVTSVAKAKGMPNARQAFVPVPMFNQPADVLRGYVEGDDPWALYKTLAWEMYARARPGSKPPPSVREPRPPAAGH